MANDELVLVTRPARTPTATEVFRVQGGQEALLASTPALFPSDLAPSVHVTAKGWWYAREGGAEAGVSFVVDDGTVRRTRVALPRQNPVLWLPIRGDRPRGVEVFVAEEQPALRLAEVTPEGVQPAAAFDWWDTGFHQTLRSARWSASALNDRRIAVVAVDGPPDEMSLRLRILDAGAGTESTVACAAAIDWSLATASNDAHQLAIIGLTRERAVLAVLVDADQPESARCRALSAPNERAATPPFGTPDVVWTGTRFVAAWIREDGVIRACELGNLDAPPLVMNVAADADVERPLRQLLQAGDDEHVTFLWRERSGAIAMRTLPEFIGGFAFGSELRDLFCNHR